MKKYHCYTNKDNLPYLSKTKVKNIKTIDDKISFYTNQKNYDYLIKIIDLEASEIGLSNIRNFFKKQLITIIGIILIIFAIINQSKSIVGTKFTNYDTYNQEILDYLNKYYKKIGPYSYLNADLNTINTDLRKTFYNYEWIGIYKKGSYLYIDIKDISLTNYEDDKRPGAYYANYDGIVKRYHLEKGIILVQEEQYVAKGDLLISGAIPYHAQEPQYIRAKGYVIAEVLQYKEYYIPLRQLSRIKTGKILDIRENYIFNKKVTKNKNTFLEFEKIETINFKLFNLFKSVNVCYYEIKNIEKIYTETEAIEYAKSLVEKEFRAAKVNPFENIIFNELVKIEVIDNNYYVKLITKTYQNIAKFYPYEIRQ